MRWCAKVFSRGLVGGSRRDEFPGCIFEPMPRCVEQELWFVSGASAGIPFGRGSKGQTALNFEAHEAHELERVAFGNDAFAQSVVEMHFSVFDLIFEVHIPN